MTENTEKKACFFLLTEPAKDISVCHLAQLYYERGKTVYIFARDQRHADALDSLLWTFDEQSFVPHEVYGGEPDAAVEAPVVIGTNSAVHHDFDIFIAGAHFEETDMPFITRFDSVIDFADQYDDNLVLLSRKRYQMFREHNYEMHTSEKRFT